MVLSREGRRRAPKNSWTSCRLCNWAWLTIVCADITMPPSASAVQQRRYGKATKGFASVECIVFSSDIVLLLSIWGIAFELDQRQSHLFDSLLLLLLGRDRKLISCFNFFVYQSGFSPLKSNENHPKIACASSPFFSIAVADDEKKIHSAAEREFTVWSRSSIHCFPYLSLSLFLSSALFFAYSLLSTWTTKSFVIFIYYNDIGTHMLRGPPTTTKYELLNSPFVSLSLLLFFSNSRRSVILCRLEY
jgi:hypothetical protein